MFLPVLLVEAASRHDSPWYIAVPVVLGAIAIGLLAMYLNLRRRR